MELIWEGDPKPQTRRVADGLYLFYGCSDDGREMNRADLLAVAQTVPALSLVKEQRMAPVKVMGLMRRIDDVFTRAELQEGLVVFVNDVRFKLKSWQYLNACGTPAITPAWLDKQIKSVKTLDQLHDTCEGWVGALDDNLVARQLLAQRLTAAHKSIDEIARHPRESVEEIKTAPKAWQPVLFQLFKRPNFWDDAAGVLSVVKMLL